MRISGTYRSSSGVAGAGTITVTAVNIRGFQPMEIEAGADGAWTTPNIEAGTYRISYASGWATSVLIAGGNVDGVEPPRSHAGLQDWIIVGSVEGPAFANGWSGFTNPLGDASPRFRLDGATVYCDGQIAGPALEDGLTPDMLDAIGRVFLLPEGYRPDRMLIFPARSYAIGEGGALLVDATIGVGAQGVMVMSAPAGALAVLFAVDFPVA